MARWCGRTRSSWPTAHRSASHSAALRLPSIPHPTNYKAQRITTNGFCCLLNEGLGDRSVCVWNWFRSRLFRARIVTAYAHTSDSTTSIRSCRLPRWQFSQYKQHQHCRQYFGNDIIRQNVLETKTLRSGDSYRL